MKEASVFIDVIELKLFSPAFVRGPLIEGRTRREDVQQGRRVFPRIRAGASLKGFFLKRKMPVLVVFPRIRAGASLKGRHDRQAVRQPGQFSPAFVRGPH